MEATITAQERAREGGCFPAAEMAGICDLGSRWSAGRRPRSPPSLPILPSTQQSQSKIESEMEGSAGEMTAPLRKRKAAASPARNRPDKSRRGSPPYDLQAPASAWTAAGSGSSISLSAHYLRSGRTIFVPIPHKAGPMQLTKRQKAVYDISWRSPTACAEAALKHYNRSNEDEHELVIALEPAAFLSIGGMWIHANFIAKPKGGTGCADRAPKSFFAELKIDPNEKVKQKLLCVSCIKMDQANPKTNPVRGCKRCPIFHPAAGGYQGAAGGHRGAA